MEFVYNGFVLIINYKIMNKKHITSIEFRKKIKSSIKLRWEELEKELELEKSYVNDKSKVYA
jgi:hypothetical protein